MDANEGAVSDHSRNRRIRWHGFFVEIIDSGDGPHCQGVSDAGRVIKLRRYPYGRLTPDGQTLYVTAPAKILLLRRPRDLSPGRYEPGGDTLACRLPQSCVPRRRGVRCTYHRLAERIFRSRHWLPTVPSLSATREPKSVRSQSSFLTRPMPICITVLNTDWA
jgi:hypothetical protein